MLLHCMLGLDQKEESTAAEEQVLSVCWDLFMIFSISKVSVIGI